MTVKNETKFNDSASVSITFVHPVVSECEAYQSPSSLSATATRSKSCATNKLNASVLPGGIHFRSVQKKTAQERWTAHHTAPVINLDGPIMDEDDRGMAHSNLLLGPFLALLYLSVC